MNAKPRFMILLVVMAAAVGTAAVSPAPASADVTGAFCPFNTPPAYIGLDAYPGRCIGAYHTTYSWVQTNNGLTSVNKCAVVKPNSDGSGGNVGGQIACAPGTDSAFVTFGGSGVAGYAVMINNSSNYHTGFWGLISYHT